MLKCFKTEVKGKERSLFIGTFSELEKEKKENIQLLQFKIARKENGALFCELSYHVACICLNPFVPNPPFL